MCSTKFEDLLTDKIFFHNEEHFSARQGGYAEDRLAELWLRFAVLLSLTCSL